MKIKLSVQVTLAALTTIAVALPVVSAQAAEVEVLHYWTSGGEAKSVAELKKMMEAKGITWKDFAVAGGGGENAMTALKARVIAGSAPTAAQIKGPSIQEWGKEGVLANIDAVAVAEKWDSREGTQGEGASTDLRYVIRGTDDDTDAKIALVAESP